jgi:hypothetical protein
MATTQILASLTNTGIRSRRQTKEEETNQNKKMRACGLDAWG